MLLTAIHTTLETGALKNKTTRPKPQQLKGNNMSLIAVSFTNDDKNTTLNVYLDPGENLKFDIDGNNVFEVSTGDLEMLAKMVEMAIESRL